MTVTMIAPRMMAVRNGQMIVREPVGARERGGGKRGYIGDFATPRVLFVSSTGRMASESNSRYRARWIT